MRLEGQGVRRQGRRRDALPLQRLNAARMPALRFTKMQGLGNDFVVVDGIRQRFDLAPAELRRLADRRYGVGCDQILVVERPTRTDVDFRYRILERRRRRSRAVRQRRALLRLVRPRPRAHGEATDPRRDGGRSDRAGACRGRSRWPSTWACPDSPRRRSRSSADGRRGDPPARRRWGENRSDARVDGQPARSAGRGRRRRCAGDHARTEARNGPAIPRARECRLHGGRGSRYHSAACLGAWRRGDAGVRHRGLRGGGHRHKARACSTNSFRLRRAAGGSRSRGPARGHR